LGVDKGNAQGAAEGAATSASTEGTFTREGITREGIAIAFTREGG
jgi:hypothetical protein